MEEQGMIERVARAICSELDYDLDNPAIAQFRGMYLRMARAAIEAMREPTPEMTAVMANYIGRVDQVSATYYGMIDAALNDQERT